MEANRNLLNAFMPTREDQRIPPTSRFSTIGDMARTFGISPRALRFYEDKKLLQPIRRGTTRFYGDRDRASLKLILKGKQLGFTLREIAEMLPREAFAADGANFEFSLLPERITTQIEQLRRQQAALEEAICELCNAHQRLTQATTSRKA